MKINDIYYKFLIKGEEFIAVSNREKREYHSYFSLLVLGNMKL